jgi:diguanylate cyclase (GGDEF)-like protein
VTARHRVLVADDDPLTRRLLEANLAQWGFQVETVTDGAAAWETIRSPQRPPVAILDWMMPGLSGIELCRRARAEAGEPYLYLIMLTGRDSSDDLVHALEAGADDFIGKPIRMPELRARLGTARRLLDLQRQLITAREAQEFRATFDALTGVRNRRAILEMLDNEINRAARTGQPLSIALADIDHFKSINDTHGHQVGDVVLEEVAGRLEVTLRSYDAVGRYGGEEFLVVLPSADPEAALAVAERIRSQVARPPTDERLAELRVTVSLGVASLADVPADGPPEQRAEALLRAADQAMYRAKAAGRDRTVLAAA